MGEYMGRFICKYPKETMNKVAIVFFLCLLASLLSIVNYNEKKLANVSNSLKELSGAEESSRLAIMSMACNLIIDEKCGVNMDDCMSMVKCSLEKCQSLRAAPVTRRRKCQNEKAELCDRGTYEKLKSTDCRIIN